MRTATRLLALTGALALAPAGAASAHVQVRPAAVAPGDAVLFEVLVPNEGEGATTSVELKIPPGVIPFSFEATHGWKRSIKAASDGSTGSVLWTGRMATDGFARFSFLASTPEREGAIEWKAVQRYDDGEVARWIGGPGTEEPAAVTKVSRVVARSNAGGELAKGAGAAAPADSREPAGGDDRDSLALGIGTAGLALGVVALGVALSSRRRTS